MKSWVIVSIGVALAAAISAKPLSRLRKPEKNDKLKIGLSVALILAAVVIAYAPRKTKRTPRMVGGAQCTVKTVAPQIGAGYQPYVVPEDLKVGGAAEYFEPAPVIEPIKAIEPTYDVAAVAPDGPAVAGDIMPMDIVEGGTLHLVGDF